MWVSIIYNETRRGERQMRGISATGGEASAACYIAYPYSIISCVYVAVLSPTQIVRFSRSYVLRSSWWMFWSREHRSGVGLAKAPTHPFSGLSVNREPLSWEGLEEILLSRDRRSKLLRAKLSK